MYFSDMRSIADAIPSRDQRVHLLRTLKRDATFLVHVKISPKSDIERLANYWGRGGRTHEVRPILESLMQRGGESINITHLLPPLARRKLYTYPPRSVLSSIPAGERDCHWTSLNFFNEAPDESSNSRNAGKTAVALETKYYRIGGNLRLGDIAVLVNSRKKVVHCAVYIADDVFFHKCGSRSFTPWELTRRKHLEAYYPSRQEYKIYYYRRYGL